MCMLEIYILSFVDSKELGRLRIDAVWRKQYMFEESRHLWRLSGAVFGGFQVTESSKLAGGVFCGCFRRFSGQRIL